MQCRIYNGKAIAINDVMDIELQISACLRRPMICLGWRT